MAVALADHHARALAATGHVRVSPTRRSGWWELTAHGQVGTLVVDDLRLLIRPRIRPENLFLLLEVGLPETAWRSEAFQYDSDSDLLSAVVSFFARTVETTLARGVFRSYIERHERLATLRGRVDIETQIQRAGMVMPIACRHDDFTSDVAENRYLRTAIRRSLQVARVPARDRRRLLQQLVALEDVDDTPLPADALDRIVINRLNAHYEPALRLARLLLDNLTLVDRGGGTSTCSFMLDMHDTVERFVTERLRRALTGRLEVRARSMVQLGEEHHVGMRPDLELRRNGTTVYVGDISYGPAGDADARSANHYQLLAYTIAMDLPEGVVVHCVTDGVAPEGTLTVRHAGKVLRVRSIDLSCAPAAVATGIAELADWLVAASPVA